MHTKYTISTALLSLFLIAQSTEAYISFNTLISSLSKRKHIAFVIPVTLVAATVIYYKRQAHHQHDLDMLLVQAVKEGKKDEVTRLLTEGANVHTELQKGVRLLHIPAMSGNITIMELLFAHGADSDIEHSDTHGITPLYGAVINLQEKIVRFLIEHGANVNRHAKNETNPLHFLSLAGKGTAHTSIAIAQLLIDNGIDIDKKEKTGLSPLHLAAGIGFNEMVELLLNHGAEIDAQNALGFTPLYCAVIQNQIETAQMLINRGADTNGKNDRCRSPLVYAVDNGHKECIELLIKNGADIEKEAARILTLASLSGNDDIVRTLLDCGVKATATDNEGASPLHWISALTDSKKPIEVVHVYAKIINTLLENGAEINAITKKTGQTALDTATHKEMIKVLRAAGAKFSAELKLIT